LAPNNNAALPNNTTRSTKRKKRFETIAFQSCFYPFSFLSLKKNAMEDTPEKPEKPTIPPDEQLREENEFLKMKLLAETGAEFGQLDSIDPAIENLFLNNVIEFERQHAQAETTTVYELLGKPEFIKSEQLSDEQVVTELERIDSILNEHNIVVDYLAEYPERLKYSFVTEELFLHESNMFMSGMTYHYIYEEFHPNHPLDITNRAKAFIESWFKQQFTEYNTELSNQWFTDQGKIHTKEEVLQKFQQFFDCYKYFENAKYELQNVKADVEEGGDTGLGFAEGLVKYDAVSENGEITHFGGPFKLYLHMNYDWWDIFFAYWPGLKW
jgi:hypothetical protein